MVWIKYEKADVSFPCVEAKQTKDACMLQIVQPLTGCGIEVKTRLSAGCNVKPELLLLEIQMLKAPK
jgi:hypothetical protein